MHVCFSLDSCGFSIPLICIYDGLDWIGIGLGMGIWEFNHRYSQRDGYDESGNVYNITAVSREKKHDFDLSNSLLVPWCFMFALVRREMGM